MTSVSDGARLSWNRPVFSNPDSRPIPNVLLAAHLSSVEEHHSDEPTQPSLVGFIQGKRRLARDAMSYQSGVLERASDEGRQRERPCEKVDVSWRWHRPSLCRDVVPWDGLKVPGGGVVSAAAVPLHRFAAAAESPGD